MITKEALLKKVPTYDAKEPALYALASEEMDKLVWVPIDRDLPASNMAFATRSKNGMYKIFVNNRIPDAYKSYFTLHEFGHVLFGHLRDSELRATQLKRKMISAWDTIKKHIEFSDDDVNLPPSALVSKYLSPMSQMFTNIAMDFEVNSKLFSDDEWGLMKKITNASYIVSSVEDDASQEEMQKFDDFLEGKEDKLCEPCWPVDYGFEKQKSYLEYLDLMMINIDKFMDDLSKNQDQNQDSDGEGQEGEGQGNSNGECSSNQKKSSEKGNSGDDESSSEQAGNSKSSGDKSNKEGSDSKSGNKKPRKLTLEQIQEMRDSFSDIDEKVTRELEKASNEAEGNKESKNESNGNFCPVGHSPKDADILPLSSNALAKFLEKECFSKCVRNTRINTMYNYNRKKYNTDVIIPKVKEENRYRPGNLYILVDCSGSVSETAISNFLGTLNTLSKKCGPKSRVIWWDTKLCGDAKLVPGLKAMSGGGTDIAPGIEYIAKNYLKNDNDKLVIISDFCDSLGAWQESLKKVRNDVIGICWGERVKNDSVSDYIMNSCYGGSFVPSSFLKKVHTKIIDINK